MNLEEQAVESEIVTEKKSPAKPKMRRRFFQFRLLALLLLAIPFAFAATQVRGWLDDRPVDWKPYSKAELDRHIRDKKTVLVFLSAEWDFTSKLAETMAFDSSEVKRILRSRKVAAMRAELVNPDSLRLAKTLRDSDNLPGQNFCPLLIIFSRQSGGKPIVLDPYSPAIGKRLYTALSKEL